VLALARVPYYGQATGHGIRAIILHSMSHLSIEVTPERHRRLKAIAALCGKTIKDYILEQALPSLPETDALSEAEAFH
jgi:Antitoxin ParD